MNDFHDLCLILKSRFPIVVVETAEEQRMLTILERATDSLNWPLFVWSVTDGIKRARRSERMDRSDRVSNTYQLSDALRHICLSLQNGVYALLDAHPYLNQPEHQRMIRDIAQNYYKTERTLVLISPELELPSELQRMAATFKLPLPDLNGIKQIINEEAQLRHRQQGEKPKGDKAALELLSKQLVGMLPDDARRLIRSCLEDGAITMDDVRSVMRFKQEKLSTGGLLEIELEAGHFKDVAGLSYLKQWLERRKTAFLGDAKAMGLDEPKGILLLGVQGSGKSLAAKATAGSWGVPLLRLDFATLYNKFSGETERNLREALANAEAMAPCVLWIDEIEKGLAGDTTGSGDSGVSRRVLGSLLTWMAERKKPVFVAATANDISALPPELLRKGRFDEIFFVDLPDASTREEIFRIHLKRRNLSPEAFDCKYLAQSCAGYSGAEIEQAIVSGLYEAHAVQSPLTEQHILDELARSKPLSVMMAERVDELRAWAQERTVSAG